MQARIGIIIMVGLLTGALARAQNDGIAIVELFTSEGCSSCPPADELLMQIHKDAVARNKNIFTLEFHVDYWNRLGWADPFSNPLSSQRQSDYAQKFKLDSVYTPQMIVNGTNQFVGSDRHAADGAIDTALQQGAMVRLSAKVKDRSATSATIEFHASDIKASDVINVAVVEDGLWSSVQRGENDGRRLHHDSVVRFFTTRSASDHDAVVDLSGVSVDHASAIVFMQDKQSYAVKGAVAVSLK